MSNSLSEPEKKVVAFVGTDGLPARYGGYETLLAHITPLLGNSFDVLVFCSKHGRSEKQRCYDKNGVRLIYLNIPANGIYALLYDSLSIWLARKSDVIFVLGPSVGFLFWCLKFIFNGKLVVHLDGLEWKRSQWGWFTRNLAKINEKMSCHYSQIIISDNRAISDYIEKGYPRTKYVEIPYGGDHCTVSNYKRFAVGYKTTVAYSICRIVPENSIELILKAFSRSPSWILKFWGNWDSSKYARDLKKKYNEYPNLELLSPEYDQSKLSNEIGQCCLYIHGHTVGGTNPSLVEAMHRGSNIACIDNSFNRNTSNNLGFFFTDVDSLVSLLELKNNVTDHLKFSDSIQQFALEKYTWELVHKKYEELIDTL